MKILHVTLIVAGTLYQRGHSILVLPLTHSLLASIIYFPLYVIGLRLSGLG